MVTKKKRIKRSFRDNVFSIFLGSLIVGLIIILIYSNIKINKRRSELMAEIQRLETEIWTLEEKSAQFRVGISEVNQEDYWEERIREEGFVREGEEPIVVVAPEETEEEKKEEPREEGFWEGLLKKISDFFQK